MSAVTRPVLARIDGQKFRVDFRWDSRDPFAVAMTIHAAEDVEWMFALDLLADGVNAPVGEMDVKVAPGRHGFTVIRLSNRDGQADLVVPTYEIQAFLAETWIVEPRIPTYLNELFPDLAEEAS